MAFFFCLVLCVPLKVDQTFSVFPRFDNMLNFFEAEIGATTHFYGCKRLRYFVGMEGKQTRIFLSYILVLL